jgi:hypothetical protein
MRSTVRCLSILQNLAVCIALAGCVPPAGPPPAAPGPATGTPVGSHAWLGRLPLYFIENRGQVDARVAYTVQARGMTSYFTTQGVTFALLGQNDRPTDLGLADRRSALDRPADRPAEPEAGWRRWTVALDFVGANPDAGPVGQDRTETIVSYFKGPMQEWKTGIATYAAVVYEDIWPGIDLVYSGDDGRLKYTFLVRPGADPSRIALAYRGASDVRLTEAGQLEVSTPLGGFRDDTPYAYQDVAGQRQEVVAAYALEAAEHVDVYRFGFRLGAYDPDRPLVLDPAFLVYAGYVGGGDDDSGRGIAVNSVGNAFVVGSTKSSQASFPDTVGPDLGFNGDEDAFVAKVKADGTALLYAGYIGGSDSDQGFGIAVDGVGNAYVTGLTLSSQASFPVTGGPDLGHNGSFDGFIAKVNPGGTALVYAGYIGGSQQDRARAVALKPGCFSSCEAYVTGRTNSTQASFPVAVGPDLSHNGSDDAFVAKVKADGSGLGYAGYIGGVLNDSGAAIAVDGDGNAYVGGIADSSEATFPVQVGPDLTQNGSDGFVAKVNADGSGLAYAGYVGGEAEDDVNGIAVDSDGNAYVTGATPASQATFPVTVGPDLSHNGGSDAFVAKVKADGSGFVYAGYIGGSGEDSGGGIAVDVDGNVYVTGSTSSSAATFPVKEGPDLTYNGGSIDAFVAKVKADGTALLYAGYIGGSSGDGGTGIAVDKGRRAYVTGGTDSSAATFPVKKGPDLTYNGGSGDAFVAKVAFFQFLAPPGVFKLATGAGSLVVPGGEASFEFNVHQRAEDQPVAGELTYTSPTSGLRVRSVEIAALEVEGGEATFTGACTNNGVPCRFTVFVQDNGEPGRDDVFTIEVTDTSRDGGVVHEAGTLRSGNIQVQERGSR